MWHREEEEEDEGPDILAERTKSQNKRENATKVPKGRRKNKKAKNGCSLENERRMSSLGYIHNTLIHISHVLLCVV